MGIIMAARVGPEVGIIMAARVGPEVGPVVMRGADTTRGTLLTLKAMGGTVSNSWSRNEVYPSPPDICFRRRTMTSTTATTMATFTMGFMTLISCTDRKK